MAKAQAPSGGDSGIRERVVHGVRRIIHAVDLHSRQLSRAHEITAPQLATLEAIAAADAATASEIAQRVHLSTSTLVGILDRLEAKGLITRLRDTADRRRIHLTATAAGCRLAGRAGSPVGEALSEGLAELSGRRQAQIAGALEAVADILERRSGA